MKGSSSADGKLKVAVLNARGHRDRIQTDNHNRCRTRNVNTSTRIVLLGPPGAGKGTQATQLAEHLNVVHLSAGDLLRDAVRLRTDIGRQAARFLVSGQLVPDALVQQLVFQRISHLDTNRGLLFDGFPRTISQAKALNAHLEDCELQLELAIQINVDVEVLRKRLRDRGRHDDRSDVVALRLKEYRELTEPLTAYYRAEGLLREVNGNGTPGEVFDSILGELKARRT